MSHPVPLDTALAVTRHLAEGCGVRQTGPLVGVNKNTVIRLALLACQCARQHYDESVGISPLYSCRGCGELLRLRTMNCPPRAITQEGFAGGGSLWRAPRPVILALTRYQGDGRRGGSGTRERNCLPSAAPGPVSRLKNGGVCAQ
jgi:hypothetical protein